MNKLSKPYISILSFIGVLFLIGFGLISCGSNVKSNETTRRCPVVLKSGKFERILIEEHHLAHEKDTLVYNEMKFECTTSAFSTQKMMFDNYGEWNDIKFVERVNIPILTWKQVDLFSDGKMYTIMASGDENSETIYGSVIVMDENGIDALVNASEIDRFSQQFELLIKKNDWSDKEYINLLNEVKAEYHNSKN